MSRLLEGFEMRLESLFPGAWNRLLRNARCNRGTAVFGPSGRSRLGALSGFLLSISSVSVPGVLVRECIPDVLQLAETKHCRCLRIHRLQSLTPRHSIGNGSSAEAHERLALAPSALF